MFELGTLKALEQFLSTEEEMEQIKDYLKTGDVKMLGKAEQFFVLVCQPYIILVLCECINVFFIYL